MFPMVVFNPFLQRRVQWVHCIITDTVLRSKGSHQPKVTMGETTPGRIKAWF